jgi:beta-xylosidase
MHQLVQNDDIPFQGRPQCLEPVNWVDGWPIIGVDENNDGIGEPVKRHTKPIQGYPIAAPDSDDDFSSEILGSQWEWNHNPRNTHWSLSERPGKLRLHASPVLPNKEGHGPQVNQWTNNDGSDSDFWRASNTISQRIMGINAGVAVSKIELSGMKPHQVGGFVRFGGTYNLLGVEVDENGKRNLFYMDSMSNKTTGPEIVGNDLYVRTTNVSNQAIFEYSLDGVSFSYFGPVFTISFGKWTGDRLGFFTWSTREEESGYIDIDWFEYDYEGPKSSKV